MFSKALFKQSCKANGTMWGIITFAVCFMLACVMLISGSGSIGDTKNAIQNTIVEKEIDSQFQKRALNYYENSTDGLAEFDKLFVKNAGDSFTYHAHFSAWLTAKPEQGSLTAEEYAAAINAWRSNMPQPTEKAAMLYAKNFSDWQNAMPEQSDFNSSEEYAAAMNKWNLKNPATPTGAVTAAYAVAYSELNDYVYGRASEKDYAKDSAEAQEMLGSVMFALNPSHYFDADYTAYGEKIPEEYDVNSLVSHISAGDIQNYLVSEERAEYIGERCENASSIFLAGNMTKDENVNKMIDGLSSYGITREKYESFGYADYANVRHLANTVIITYSNRYDYEMQLLADKYADGGFESEEEYRKAMTEKNEELVSDIAGSFLSTLPSDVSEALEEIGEIDLYSLIVGSIFYKLAGLLLPIIYMIMASNNLIAGQVDSGSMAYVLSTSTKRKTVVFTQGVFLAGSLFAMFCLTTVTGVICLSFVSEDIELTYGNLILLNIGAFLVLFALSGLCFFTSCYFDRSKRCMAIGGGLSIFALVAAMLGLFGSPVIPSVVRLKSLNYFNYATIISLFDVISIIDGTKVFLWKFAILLVLGIIGYIVGSLKFTKKDLPL